MPDYMDLKLNPLSDPAVQRETPHGIIRTLLHASNDPHTTPAQLSLRYDEQRLIWTLILGTDAAVLADKMIDWLWEHFPSSDTEASAFGTQVYEFLQGDARNVGESAMAHSLVIGALTRTVNSGRIWLAWLGTAGVRALNANREVLPIEKGLVAGEGWAPRLGVIPERVRPHAEVLAVNAVDRLLTFSNVLRPAIDEIPFLGRAVLQRLAESRTSEIPAVLFELHPYQVVPMPDAVTLRYRWENPHEATLLWAGSANATGYHIQQDITPRFDNPRTIAELVDARQRLYKVQPPAGAEVYYRVVPIAENALGQPSPPVAVTPVPLVTPYLEPVTWLPSGNFRLNWSALPQADVYELESSPDPEFDGPQTGVIYQGEANTYETERRYPAGWYFRVRSLNTNYAPKTPSLWSNVQQAPARLSVPTFTHVSADRLEWTPIAGATHYEIRDMDTQALETVENAFFQPPGKPAVYQIRALRAEGEGDTASVWSRGISVGEAANLGKVAQIAEESTVRIPLLKDDKTTKIRQVPDEKTAELPSSPTIPVLSPGTGGIWRVGLIAAGLALAFGLIIGLIGGPRLGIGLDPSPTPLTRNDRDATATQQYVFVDRATHSVILNQELSQVQAAGTEEANTLNLQNTRSAELSGNLATQQSVATQSADEILELQNDQATAGANLSLLEQTATQASENIDQLSGTLVNQYAIASLDASLIAELQATGTQIYATGSALEADLENQRAAVASSADEIATLEAAAISSADEITTLEAAAISSADEIATLEAAATINSAESATLDANLASVQMTATQASQENLENMVAIIQTQTAVVTSYAATHAALEATFTSAQDQLTVLAGSVATFEAEIANAQATIAAQQATIERQAALIPTPTPTLEPSPIPSPEPTRDTSSDDLFTAAGQQPEEVLSKFVSFLSLRPLRNDVRGLVADGEQITIFAPNNAAFENNPELEAQLTSDSRLLLNTFRYHIVLGTYTVEDLLAMDGETLTTREGSVLMISVVDGEVVLNGSVHIVTADIPSSNGVLHIIDGVLTPTATEDKPQ